MQRKGRLRPNNALEGRPPHNDPTSPIAYTIINGTTRLWVPVSGGCVTVNPSAWGLTNRIVGKAGTWRYEERGMGQHYLVHSNANNIRDAFKVVVQERDIPEGVRKIDEKRPKGTLVFLRGKVQKYEKVHKFIADSIANPQKHGTEEIRPLTTEETKEIKVLIGVDVSKAVHKLNSDDLRHMLKEHGDEKKEKSRGQVAITETDLNKIPDIIDGYDRIERGSTDKYGRKSIRYKKRENGTITYIEVVLGGNNVLSGKTMWKTPSGRVNANSPDHTSKTAPGSGVDRNIAEKAENVNPTFLTSADLPGVKAPARPLLTVKGVQAIVNDFRKVYPISGRNIIVVKSQAEIPAEIFGEAAGNICEGEAKIFGVCHPSYDLCCGRQYGES